MTAASLTLSALRPSRKLGLALLLLTAAALPAQTVVKDKAAAAMLLGTHPLSLQWITFDKTKGSVTITESGGTYSVKGEQRGKDKDLLTIDGQITAINAKDFSFKGKIVTRVSHIANGRDCVRDGTFLFRITGARPFWRMRENQNPCDEAADYVDIYLTKAK